MSDDLQAKLRALADGLFDDLPDGRYCEHETKGPNGEIVWEHMLYCPNCVLKYGREAAALALEDAAETIPSLFHNEPGSNPPGWSADLGVIRGNNVAVKNIASWLRARAEEIRDGK